MEVSLKCSRILSRPKHGLLFCVLLFHLTIIIFHCYYLLFYLLRSLQVSFRFTTEETPNQPLRYNKPYTNTKHTIHSIFSFCCTTNGQSPQYHMKKHPHVGLGTGATALKWRIYANTFLPPAEPCCLFWLLSPVSQVCEFSALWQRSSRLLSLIIRYHPKFCLSCPLFCPCKTEIKAQV